MIRIAAWRDELLWAAVCASMATSRNLMEVVLALGPETENSENLHKGFPGGWFRIFDAKLSS